MHPSRNSYTAPAALLNDIAHSGEHVSTLQKLACIAGVWEQFPVPIGISQVPAPLASSSECSLHNRCVTTIVLIFFQVDPFAQHRQPTIAEREDEYRARRRQMVISPPRNDPFADGRCPDVIHPCFLSFFIIRYSLLSLSVFYSVTKDF